MLNEEKRIEYYSNMADKLNDMTVEGWERIVLYARVSENTNFLTFYYYIDDGECYDWTWSAEENYSEEAAKAFSIAFEELKQINKEYWQECREAGESWSAFTFGLNEDWSFDIKFDYEIDESLTELEAEVRWAYDTLEVIPNYVYAKKLLMKYLTEQGRELPDKLIYYGADVSVVDTPDKYVENADELITLLVDFLRKLNLLEEEIFMRSVKLDEAKYKAGVQSHIEGPGQKELWKEYHTRFAEIAENYCTTELLDRGFSGSFSSSTEYGYIDKNCQLIFTMKSANRAVIETRFSAGVEKKHQFVLKHTEEGWRVSAKSYGFRNDKTWHKDSI